VVGIILGRSGALYAAERGAGRVSKIRPDGTKIILLEGLNQPRDPAFDAAGNLYVAETGTGRILRLSGDY
jgi:sugar lactone lactonase YvrE